MVKMNTEKIEMKYAVTYLRVSTTEQVDNFSLDNQFEQTHKKAEKDEYIIVKDFKEEGQSAKTTNRPALKELLSYCIDKKNNISAVYVYKWDRFSRNQLDFLSLRHMLSQHGVGLISATETSGNTPEALFLQNILSAAAQYDNDLKSTRVKDGMRKRFLAGYSTTKPPIGFKVGIVEGKTCGIPDERLFKPLQRMWYEIDVNKWTLGKVREELDKLCLQDAPFHRQTVSKIFANKYYTGMLSSAIYGETKGKHIPMVEPDVFYRVRELITGRKQAKSDVRKDIRDEVPLRRHLYCPLCNKNMTGAPSKSKSGKIIWYYTCPDRKLHKTFEVNAEKIHEQFKELLKRVRVKPATMKYFSEMMKETYQKDYEELNISSKHIEKDIAELYELLQTLKRKHLKGMYSDSEFIKMKDELNLEFATKKSLLSEKKIDKIEIETVLEWMTFYLTHFDKAWDRAEILVKHMMQSSLLPEKITLDEKILRTPKLGSAYRLNELYEAQKFSKYTRRDSNPRPLRPKRSALIR
jgi:site-specific DNA recombinase